MDTSPRHDASDPKESLDVFLANNKPSLTHDDGTKPWIWVLSSRRNDNGIPSDSKQEAARDEASTVLEEAAKEVERIEADPKIPTRGSKKVKSKKTCRDEAAAQATSSIRDVALKYGYTNGKWLFFRAPASGLDSLFATLARSLLDGPLSHTPANALKVGTSQGSPVEGVPEQHVICLYYDNVYSKEDTAAILKVLAKDHGLKPSSVKGDLTTMIGLDSKHPSKIRSTVWQPKEVMSLEEIDALIKAYEDAKPTTSTPASSSTAKSNSKKRLAPPPVDPSVAARKQAKRAKQAFGSDSDDSDDVDGDAKGKGTVAVKSQKVEPATSTKEKAVEASKGKKTEKKEEGLEENGVAETGHRWPTSGGNTLGSSLASKKEISKAKEAAKKEDDSATEPESD